MQVLEAFPAAAVLHCEPQTTHVAGGRLDLTIMGASSAVFLAAYKRLVRSLTDYAGDAATLESIQNEYGSESRPGAFERSLGTRNVTHC